MIITKLISFLNFKTTLEKTLSTYVFVIVILFEYPMLNALKFLSLELGLFSESKITIWFYKFQLIEYDNKNWIENFKMTKEMFFPRVYMIEF